MVLKNEFKRDQVHIVLLIIIISGLNCPEKVTVFKGGTVIRMYANTYLIKRKQFVTLSSRFKYVGRTSCLAKQLTLLFLLHTCISISFQDMLHRLLTTFLGCLLTVHGRDPGRTFKSIPTITGSLVNLGKMDISFHFNSKGKRRKLTSSSSYQKHPSTDELGLFITPLPMGFCQPHPLFPATNKTNE